MAGVQFDTELDQAAAHPLPHPGVVVHQRALPGEVQTDPLTGPRSGHVGRAAHRCRTAADHNHRLGGGEAIVRGAQSRGDLIRRLQAGLAPEAVRDSC